MTDVWFVVAGWGVIVGGLALYGVTLLRRLRAAQAESLRVRHEADSAPPLEERR